jgi:hypothetical protein
MSTGTLIQIDTRREEWLEQRKLEAISLIPLRRTIAEVATELGLHESVVYRLAHKHGLKPMPHSGMKNTYEERGDSIAIAINSPKYGYLEALIDAADLGRVSSVTDSYWRAAFDKRIGKFYVATTTRGSHASRKLILLHRLIMNAPDGLEVDHIGHDALDNRRSNLRLADSSLNQLNRRAPSSRNSTGFLGVDFNKQTGKFRAIIRVKNKAHCLGYFLTAEQANAALCAYRVERGLPCQPA